MDKLAITCVWIVGLCCVSWGSEVDRCPHGLSRTSYLKTFNGYCYQFNHYQERAITAQSICKHDGGHLVVIKDAATQSFLMNSLRSLHWHRNGVWIGATDADAEMRWKWITGEAITYKNWASGQPSCKPFACREDCAILRYSDRGLWHDKMCDSRWHLYSFICQYDMTPTTTTSTTKVTTLSTATTTTFPTTTTEEIKIVKEDLMKTKTETSLNKVHKPTNKTSASTTSSPTSTDSPKYNVVVNDPDQQKQKLKNPPDTATPTGTTIALALGLVVGLCFGAVCVGVVCVVRRRRKKQTADDVTVSYANPYYGEASQPLNRVDSPDQSEQCCVLEYQDDSQAPPIQYDIPPSLSLHNPTYGTVVTVTSGDAKYNPYDLPKPTPCESMNDTYENSNPAEENFYEDIDSIKAAIAINESLQKCEEEDRYVAMPSKIVT